MKAYLELEFHHGVMLSYLPWYALAQLSRCNHFYRRVCRCHVWSTAKKETISWTKQDTEKKCPDCSQQHQWCLYHATARNDLTPGFSACQPPLDTLQFEGVSISPLYRAWLYWNFPYFSAWEVVNCAAGSVDSRHISDPWRSPPLQREETQRLHILAFLVQLVVNRSIFDEHALHNILVLFGVFEKDPSCQKEENLALESASDSSDGGSNEEISLYQLRSELLNFCQNARVVAEDLCFSERLVVTTRMEVMMKRASLEDCNRAASDAFPMLGTRAFLLDRRRRDARSTVEVLRAVLVAKLSEALLEMLHSTLTLGREAATRQPSASVLGWAHDVVASMISCEVMKEYIFVSDAYVTGESAMPRSSHTLWRPTECADADASKMSRVSEVLYHIMWLDNSDLREKVWAGDARVEVTKFDVDTVRYYETFNKEYGNIPGGVNVNDFRRPPREADGDYVRDGRLVLFLQGTLVR